MANNKTWKIAGLNFDHMHMGDLLRLVHDHPTAEIVGICDVNRSAMQGAVDRFAIPEDRIYTDMEACLTETRPDIVILCPATGDHASYTEQVAAIHDCTIIVEKPFASSLADADRMIAATQGRRLVINWPLAWYPCHRTSMRLIEEGMIGEVVEVHYYDGNRGPLWHGADKIERTPTTEMKSESWWYKSASGGGSLLDYMGYGVTLGTWFMQGRTPDSVTTTLGGAPELEVDEHSVTVARYGHRLSKFETRWGTFSDPWNQQPIPKCGFMIVGTEGAISSYDYEDYVTVQTTADPTHTRVPVDPRVAPNRSVVEHVIHALENDLPITGPLSPDVSRKGQQIVETAILSAQEGRAMELLK